MRKDLHEENRLSWNAATVAHNSHKGDQAAFLRDGGNKLYAEEQALLGDIHGLSVVHLQCNAGQDTLSLAQLGANVTGVDISDTAIDFARQLSADSGIAATFQRMDIYDWLTETARTSQRFDIVFCSYGAICWLSNLTNWARGIEAILKPGGCFVTIEFHPVLSLFDQPMERKFSYFTQEQPLTWDEGVTDYVAMSGLGLADTEYIEGIKDFKNPHRVHEFIWGIGDILTALLAAGLTLTSFQEYPYSNGFKPFTEMRNSERRWYLPKDQPTIPLMYSITAQKSLKS
jgi:2-polyprenyl-3-methyl-5-hydroxy-6-metoxy-1,4-benzoquinol methylase